MMTVLTLINNDEMKEEFFSLVDVDCTNPNKKLKNELLFIKDIISENNYLEGIAKSNPESFRSAFHN